MKPIDELLDALRYFRGAEVTIPEPEDIDGFEWDYGDYLMLSGRGYVTFNRTTRSGLDGCRDSSDTRRHAETIARQMTPEQILAWFTDAEIPEPVAPMGEQTSLPGVA